MQKLRRLYISSTDKTNPGSIEFRSSTTFWLDRNSKLDNNSCLTESSIHVRWEKNLVFFLDEADGDSSYPRRGRI